MSTLLLCYDLEKTATLPYFHSNEIEINFINNYRLRVISIFYLKSFRGLVSSTDNYFLLCFLGDPELSKYT